MDGVHVTESNHSSYDQQIQYDQYDHHNITTLPYHVGIASNHTRHHCTCDTRTSCWWFCPTSDRSLLCTTIYQSMDLVVTSCCHIRSDNIHNIHHNHNIHIYNNRDQNSCHDTFIGRSWYGIGHWTESKRDSWIFILYRHSCPLPDPSDDELVGSGDDDHHVHSEYSTESYIATQCPSID